MVSVAPTLGYLRVIFAPSNLLSLVETLAFTTSFITSTSAPKAFRPLICSSTGLAQILHPPGKGIFASPSLVSKGPTQKKLALKL